MKKKALLVFALLLTLIYSPVTAKASDTDPVKTTAVKEGDEAKAKLLLARLDEIKNMDKSTLTREQRKELRKEVREIKKDLRATGNGIYLSIGAIIIIILLLILVL